MTRRHRSRLKYLRLSDYQRVFRLLNRIVERRHDQVAWLQHLLADLPKVVGADRIIWGQFPIPLLDLPGPSAYIAFGPTWPAETRQIILQAFATGAPMADPTYRRVIDLPGRFVAIRRQDVATDEEWYGGVVYPYMAAAGVDSTVNMRFVSLLLQRFLTVSLYRTTDRRQFTPRSSAILWLFGRELFRLLERDARIAVGQDIPPREAQVLRLLREGDSEKEVAAKLKLSPYTVHDYTKSLYQRFEVSSRAELLAKVHAQQLRNAQLSLPDRLPEGVDWGFGLGEMEMRAQLS